MFQTKVVEEIKTLVFGVQLMFFQNRAVNEKMLKNIVEPDSLQMKTWHMRFTCWIPRIIDTPSEYAILVAFPRQQWLHKRAPTLRNAYIACLVSRTITPPLSGN